MRRLTIFLLVLAMMCGTSFGQKKNENSAEKDKFSARTFSGLKFRSIGPAYASGRIADFAVNPDNHKEYYVGVASGNIFKTVNSGITWEPVFEKYGSYSIGCLAMDPNNFNVVWAGTGENNSQRALGYGDGVYRTEDGGKSWKNMGLKSSRQIGEIIIHPINSDIVFVAAEGSVWGPGGERGVYKTTDGGKTWNAVLTISENTGVADMVMDPRNPDVIYAASHQRRRHVFTKIDGGPETAIYRTTDGGENWTKLKSGLPSGEMGAIGLAISPANPDYVYAIIELPGRRGGFYRTTNRGASWTKMSDHVSNSPQYYNELFADPKDPDKVYSVETYTYVTEDGGKTWNRLSNRYRHVDDHAMWIDPCDTDHFLIGGDAGIYESYDGGKEFHFKANLPITQFYRVETDNSLPFYYVYGGTQDNNSMGGPSRNTSSFGVVNDDWFVTNGGDGFWSQIDPEDPNIVYAESQYGYVVRYDRKSGESISIKPQPPSGEIYNWNWNAPLIISPHSHKRLYFAANKLFRSDDYGNTWRPLGGDLTAGIDRNKLEVMGKIWSVDAIAKNISTSVYGSIVALDESPLQEDLLYVGTDDGLIQVTEDAGANWRKIDSFPGIPANTYVSHILASKHDPNVVYASFDNLKNDDFKPYILKSTDKGKKWTSISANLPENGTVHTIEQDHVNPDLLFIGTEFGFFFSLDGGKKWIQQKSGLPTIPVRDIDIQERENDIVIATFGRGFYVLDNYTPLRHTTSEILEQDAYIFPVKDALMYIEKRGKTNQGSTYYKSENPEMGATFTYYMNESLKTKKQKRKDAEKKGNLEYPTVDELRAENEEVAPYLLFTIKDETGYTVRQLKTSASSGIKRIVWDFRYPSTFPPRSNSREYNAGFGMMALPGNYSVILGKVVDGVYTDLAGPQNFRAVVLNNSTLPAEDREELVAFQKKVSELSRAVQGAASAADNLSDTIKMIKVALSNTPAAPAELMARALRIEEDNRAVLRAFNGDRTHSRIGENQPPSIRGRLNNLIYSHYRSSSAPTQTMRDDYRIIGEEFEPQLEKLKNLISVELKDLETSMESIGAPWTPGRIPVWKK